MLSEVIERYGGREETPMELYADVFRLGEGFIQREGEPPGEFKANPLIIGYGGGRMHRKIMFEDTFQRTLEEACGWDWAFMSGCTYFGRSNSAERQSKLCALIFDIDGVGDSNLNNFLHAAFSDLGDIYPIPQHIVLSGHGIHLYYVLDEPLDLYPNIKTQAKELKYALTRRLWNRYTSTIKKPQYQGINQAFRVPGSKTKEDCELRTCTAYRLSAHPIGIEELNSFAPEESRIDLSERYRATKVTADEARKRWPEWYERVVVGGERSQWVVKRDLYDWWLRRIRSEDVRLGHRYFCVMALAIYAAKCGIYDADKVRADALTLLPHFNEISPENPFTEADVKSALECLDGRYVRFPRKDIARLTDIDMQPNKRNGRKQELHLAGARAVQEINDRYNGTNWREGNGRKPKRDLIRAYAIDHPNMSNRQIAVALGVSRNTVNRWLNPGWESEYGTASLFAEADARLAGKDTDGLPWGVWRGTDGHLHADMLNEVFDRLPAPRHGLGKE